MFLQNWSNTKECSFTFPADRAVWHHVESGVSPKLKPGGFSAFQSLCRKNSNTFGPCRRALSHAVCVCYLYIKSQHLKRPSLASTSLLTPLFFSLNFDFPISNFTTERSQRKSWAVQCQTCKFPFIVPQNERKM